MKDELGDKLKVYENRETERTVDPNYPVCVRVDGRSFHTWTKGCAKPYDPRLSLIMQATSAFLVDETNARIGYTQSDEISLILLNKTPESQMIFGGKIFKLTSVIASLATAKFNQLALEYFPDNGLATFDCRVWNVYNERDAIDVLHWRQADAERNSISMLAQSVFSHSKLQGKSCREMKLMLETVDKEWGAEPDYFKIGTFVKKIPVKKPIEDTVWNRIPMDKRPPKDTLVDRHELAATSFKLATLSWADQGSYVFGDKAL